MEDQVVVEQEMQQLVEQEIAHQLVHHKEIMEEQEHLLQMLLEVEEVVELPLLVEMLPLDPEVQEEPEEQVQIIQLQIHQ
jgi:hypothetical protein